ncbi:MAG: hypothetical protein WBM02_10710 [bacterium]
MNNSDKTLLDDKLMRLHAMAEAMYNDGEYAAALKIWSRIKAQNPNFTKIDSRILLASQKVAQTKKSPNKTAPAAYHAQRNLFVENGQSRQHHVFQPRYSGVKLKKGLRHRHVFLLMLIVSLVLVLLSFRNHRSFLIIVNPKTAKLDCYQGDFFPFGQRKIMELDAGIELDWVDYVENKDLIRLLKKGITVYNQDQFNNRIIEIFMNLGDESLHQMTERGQQSAIYYYKRVFDADFEHLVVEKIVKAFVNLARIKIVSRDFTAAQRYLDSAANFNYPIEDIFTVQQDLNVAKGSDRRYL